MSNLELALLLFAAVSTAAAILALISGNLGPKQKAVIVTVLSIIALFAFIKAFQVPPATVPTVDVQQPTATLVATSTVLQITEVSSFGCSELLTNGPWMLEGVAFNAVEPSAPYQEIDKNALQGKDILQIRINVNAASFGEGDRHDESAIIIDQPPGHSLVASLAAHGLKAENGEQIIYISLSDFEGIGNDGNFDGTHLDLSNTHLEYGPLHARFWSRNDFKVDITSIKACSS